MGAHPNLLFLLPVALIRYNLYWTLQPIVSRPLLQGQANSILIGSNTGHTIH